MFIYFFQRLTDIKSNRMTEDISNRTNLGSLKPVHHNYCCCHTRSVSQKCTVEVAVLDPSRDVKTQGQCDKDTWNQNWKYTLGYMLLSTWDLRICFYKFT